MTQSPWISSFAAIAVVSGIPLAVTLLMALNEQSVRAAIPYLTAFGSGALLGAAVIHLIPDAFSAGGTVIAIACGTVIGFALFALVDRILASREIGHSHSRGMSTLTGHFEDTNGALLAPVPVSAAYASRSASSARALVPLAFTGDAVHNLMDGMLIAAGFLTNPAFGFLTAVAIGLHELPREVGTFGLFVHGGVRPLRAVLYNLLTAFVSLAGATITLLIGSHAARFGEFILPFAAGSYLYISIAVGVPALRSGLDFKSTFGRVGALLTGFALMGVSVFVH
ncbi:MAG: ZIP family metal transporter [Gemmatimonadaceae bacterium]